MRIPREKWPNSHSQKFSCLPPPLPDKMSIANKGIRASSEKKKTKCKSKSHPIPTGFLSLSADTIETQLRHNYQSFIA